MQSLIREAFFNIFKGTEEQRAVASEAAGKKLNCVLLKVFQCLPEIQKKKEKISRKCGQSNVVQSR